MLLLQTVGTLRDDLTAPPPRGGAKETKSRTFQPFNLSPKNRSARRRAASPVQSSVGFLSSREPQPSSREPQPPLDCLLDCPPAGPSAPSTKPPFARRVAFTCRWGAASARTAPTCQPSLPS
eukprot:1194460-Prorocentrum_minimum.AAC.1